MSDDLNAPTGGNTTSLHILKSKSLATAAQNEIANLIMRGEFAMGEKLSELGLVNRLGVSRGPIREAFRALEEAGLVTISKHRGVFVKQFTADDVRELYEVRIGLDELVGRLLAPRVTDHQIQELRGLIEQLADSLAKEDFLSYFPQNILFHDRIVEMVGNKKLLTMYRRITGEMHLLRHRSIVSGGGKLISNEEHQDIVDALATRDSVVASAAMGEHGRAGYRRLLEVTKIYKTPTPAEQPIHS